MGAAAAAHRIPDWKFGEGWYERLGWSEAELDDRLRDFYDGMFRRYAAEQGKPRWGEKTPFHTAHMARMAQIFPDAAFVGIVRHPGAVAVLPAPEVPLRLRRGRGLLVGHQQADAHARASRSATGSPCAATRTSCADGEPVLRELLCFLGEPWSPEVLHHHEVQREKGAPRAVEGQHDHLRPRRRQPGRRLGHDGDPRRSRRARPDRRARGVPRLRRRRPAGRRGSARPCRIRLAGRDRDGAGGAADHVTGRPRRGRGRGLSLAELGWRSWRRGLPAPRRPSRAPGPGVRCASRTPCAGCSTGGRSRTCAPLGGCSARDRGR